MKKFKKLLKPTVTLVLTLCMVATFAMPALANKDVVWPGGFIQGYGSYNKAQIDAAINKERPKYIEGVKRGYQNRFPNGDIKLSVIRESSLPMIKNLNLNGIRSSDDFKRVEVTHMDMGSSYLPNPLDVDQLLKTDSRTRTITHSTSATTTETNGTNVSVGYQPPINLGGINANLSTSFSFSEAKTNSVQESISYTMPSQELLVKPGKTLKATYMLVIEKLIGTVDLVSNVRLQDRIIMTVFNPRESIFSPHYILEKEKMHKPEYHANVVGKGEYEAVYGSTYYLKLEYINDYEDPIMIPLTNKVVTKDKSGRIVKVDYQDKLGVIDMTDSGVRMFTENNFKGKPINLKAGYYDVNALINSGIGNDNLSSMKIPEGFKVTLFQHGGFSGNKITLGAGDCIFNSVWDNQVSSIVVEEVPIAPKKASMFTENNLGGKKVDLEIGKYDLQDLVNKGVGNDNLSSMRIPEGLKVTLYQHGGFSGDSITITAGECRFNSDWDNKVSSLVIEKY